MADPECTPKMPFYRDVDGFRLPGGFIEENFRSGLRYKARSGDIFISTFPKCGTTWVQNIVSCILRDGKTFSTGLEFMTQTPFLEFTGAESAEKMKRPGAIKVHLPFQLTPWSTEAKYIYVARNPKDVCVSYYHHTENLLVYNFRGGKFDDYFELFIEGKNDYGDYFDNLLPWYEHRNDPNVLFLTYEDLHRNTKDNILKIAEFIDPKYKAKLENDSQYFNDVLKHSSFKFLKESMTEKLSEMKANDDDSGVGSIIENLFDKDPSKNFFFRKGIVGDWRNFFSESQNERMMKKFRERTAGTDIPDLWKDYM